jgi:adenosylcobinamide-GDP ribazoletransferase
VRDAFRLAIGTLTAVPISPPTSIEAPVPGRAMALAPLIGLIPGAVTAVAAWAALQIELSPAVAAVLVVGLYALLTRGLHLDGLADTADGLAASYDRDRALAVMRRGDTGPNGLAAVVLVLLLQVAALTQVLGAVAADGFAVRGVAVLVAVAVAARLAIPLACVRGVPSARPEGLGAAVAGSVSPITTGATVILTAAAASAFGLVSDFPWYAGLLAISAVAATTALLVHRAVSRFGGITGDILGAAVEIATAAALLTLAATTP